MKVFFTDANRLEAFSDRVVAIVLTITVLELNAPHDTELAVLQAVPADVRRARTPKASTPC